ncbi:MAG: MBL fold metallo-hydrolase, partial [Synechococcaceae bacterium WB4_2_0805]|nr:MBL fold metallo-hydrolase [Synechococcaceae bacterium WB4_2_0805]
MGISQLRADLWVFPPNRHSAGGNAWLLRSSGGCSVLVDAPLLNEENQLFLESQPPGWIVLSHRQGHGQCKRWQQLLGWPVLLQEQEAYLLPNLELTNQ